MTEQDGKIKTPQLRSRRLVLFGFTSFNFLPFKAIRISRLHLAHLCLEIESLHE